MPGRLPRAFPAGGMSLVSVKSECPLSGDRAQVIDFYAESATILLGRTPFLPKQP